MAERWDYRDERGYRDRNERPVSDRAGDEVRSWFGDDEAARRRRMDEARERGRLPDRDRGHWTDRDRDGRTGLAEFADNDRASYYSGYAQPPYRDDYSTRERGFNPDPYYTRTSYTGRGPRGYQRTDERIREDVCDRLTEDHDIDASDIDLKVEAGEVTLEGTVTERRLKWLAEEIASSCSGVVDVHNHLRVKRHEAQPTGEEAHRTAEAPPRNGGSAQRTSPSRNT